MNDKTKTKAQLIAELATLRQQVVELEAVAAKHRLVEEALRQSEARFRAISELTSDYTYTVYVELDGQLVPEWVTEAFTRATGFTLAEVNRGQHICSDDLPLVRQHLQTLLSGRSDVCEYRIITKQGEVRWLRDYQRPEWDETGERVVRILGAAQDITEPKQTEEALRESEKRYRIISDLTSDYAYAFHLGLNDHFELTWATDAFTRISGFTPAEMTTYEDWLNLIHPTDAPSIHHRRELILLYGQLEVSEFRIITKKGEIRWLRDHIRPIWDEAQERVISLYGAAQDITEQKRTEEALRESENRSRSLFAETQQRLKEQTALREAGTVISSTLDLPTVLNYIAEQIGRAIDATSAYICSYDMETMTGTVLAEYFGPQASAQEQLSDLGVTYNLPRDLPGAFDFLQSDQPFHVQRVDDLNVPEAERAHLQQFGAYSTLMTRLQIGGELIGFTSLWESRRQRKFTPEEITLCQGIAQQAAIAIKNARLYAETRQRLKEQTALREAATVISSTLNPTAVLNRIAAQMGRAIDATSAYICSYEIEQMTSSVLAEYFSPRANVLEQVSDLGTIYNLPQDFPGVFAFLRSDLPTYTLHVDDPNLPENDRVHMQQYGGHSRLLIPLEIAGEIMGYIGLWESRRRREFTPEEIALGQSIAQQAAIAIKNARLYAEAQRRLKEQTAFLEAAAVISSTLDLPTILNRIVEQMGRVVDATSAYICSYEPDTMTSTVLAEYFSPQACEAERVSDLGATYKLPRDFSAAFNFLHAGQPEQVHLADLKMDDLTRGHMEQFGAQTILNIPSQIGGQVIAFAELWESRWRREFTAEEIALCQGIAQQAVVAIKNARLLEQARQDAETKAVLLQEVNHRVKNNLATIIGLLYAERRHSGIEDQVTFQAIMQDLITRVQGLATAHTLLSAAEWAPLSLSELARQIIASALQILPPDQWVSIEVSPSSVRVTPQQANHLALVINELTINTVKYAVLEGQTTHITVRIDGEGGMVLFEFRNSGPDYPPEVLSLERHNVGIYLIQNIVHKGLRGELALRNDSGAVTILRFPALIQ